MASEIGIDLGPGLTGITAYGMLRNASQQVWNTAGSAFEAFNAANIADYDIALTEQGSTGYFVGNMPAVSAGLYTLTVKQQAGGSPAVSDTRIGGGEGDWNGTTFQSVANISSRVPAALDGGYMAAKLANGVAHGGSTATLTLGTNGATAAFSVTNLGAGPAVKFDATNNGAGTAIQLFGGFVGMDVSGGDYSIQLDSTSYAIYCVDSTLSNIEFITLPTAVWAVATRTLTALDEDTTTIDIDAAVRAAVGLASANLDTQLDALPTNAELATALAAADDAVLAAIAALNNLSAAQVNAEVVDALSTDTYAEPGQGAPAATASLAAKINWLYASWRNLKTNDGTTTKLYADDGTTVVAKQTTGESAGTVSKAEWVTGP